MDYFYSNRLTALMSLAVTLAIGAVSLHLATRPQWPAARTAVEPILYGAEGPEVVDVPLTEMGTSEEAQADLRLIAVPDKATYADYEFIMLTLYAENTSKTKEWVVAEPQGQVFGNFIEATHAEYSWSAYSKPYGPMWYTFHYGRECPTGAPTSSKAIGIQPGQKIKLGSYRMLAGSALAAPSIAFEPARPGSQELSIRVSTVAIKHPDSPRLMPATVLVSAPVELTIERPVTIHVEQVKPLPRSGTFDVTEYVAATLTDVRHPREATAQMWISIYPDDYPPPEGVLAKAEHVESLFENGTLDICKYMKQVTSTSVMIAAKPNRRERQCNITVGYKEDGWDSIVSTRIPIEWEPLP